MGKSGRRFSWSEISSDFRHHPSPSLCVAKHPAIRAHAGTGTVACTYSVGEFARLRRRPMRNPIRTEAEAFSFVVVVGIVLLAVAAAAWLTNHWVALAVFLVLAPILGMRYFR